MKKTSNHLKRLALAAVMLVFIQACENNQAASMKNENESTTTGSMLTAVTAPTLYAVIGKKKIAYRTIGTGKPIILCNRFRGTLDTWDPLFLDELAKEFQVIIFDYSGIGLSSGELSTNIAEVAGDVKDLASFLKLPKFIMGGWSYGGVVAQTFSTHFPELITHTVVIGTNPPGKNANPPEEIFLTTSAKPVNDLEDEYILFFEPASEASRKAAQRSHNRIAQRTKDKDIPVPVDKFKLYFEGVADYARDSFNSREKLGKLSTPILCISGDHDCVCPIENWYPLTRKLPNLQITMLPSAGHGPQHQYVELVSKYIGDFVRHSKAD